MRSTRRSVLSVSASFAVALVLSWARPARAQESGASGAATVRPAVASPDTTWASWQLVLGDWMAESGGGEPGTASAGGDSYRPDLAGRVLVRRYWSAYPATATRSAFRDEGLMIVYPEGGGWRATAFDN